MSDVLGVCVVRVRIYEKRKGDFSFSVCVHQVSDAFSVSLTVFCVIAKRADETRACASYSYIVHLVVGLFLLWCAA